MAETSKGDPINTLRSKLKQWSASGFCSGGGHSSTLDGVGREARRFIRRLGRTGVYVVAILLTIAFFSQTEPFLRSLGLSQTAYGYILLPLMFAFAALIFFVSGQFGVHLWGRPRFQRKRSSEAPRGTRYRRSF
jgi:hypothetical protein